MGFMESQYIRNTRPAQTTNPSHSAYLFANLRSKIKSRLFIQPSSSRSLTCPSNSISPCHYPRSSTSSQMAVNAIALVGTGLLGLFPVQEKFFGNTPPADQVTTVRVILGIEVNGPDTGMVGKCARRSALGPLRTLDWEYSWQQQYLTEGWLP